MTAPKQTSLLSQILLALIGMAGVWRLLGYMQLEDGLIFMALAAALVALLGGWWFGVEPLLARLQAAATKRRLERALAQRLAAAHEDTHEAVRATFWAEEREAAARNARRLASADGGPKGLWEAMRRVNVERREDLIFMLGVPWIIVTIGFIASGMIKHPAPLVALISTIAFVMVALLAVVLFGLNDRMSAVAHERATLREARRAASLEELAGGLSLSEPARDGMAGGLEHVDALDGALEVEVGEGVVFAFEAREQQAQQPSKKGRDGA